RGRRAGVRAVVSKRLDDLAVSSFCAAVQEEAARWREKDARYDWRDLPPDKLRGLIKKGANTGNAALVGFLAAALWYNEKTEQIRRGDAAVREVVVPDFLSERASYMRRIALEGHVPGVLGGWAAHEMARDGRHRSRAAGSSQRRRLALRMEEYGVFARLIRVPPYRMRVKVWTDEAGNRVRVVFGDKLPPPEPPARQKPKRLAVTDDLPVVVVPWRRDLAGKLAAERLIHNGHKPYYLSLRIASNGKVRERPRNDRSAKRAKAFAVQAAASVGVTVGRAPLEGTGRSVFVWMRGGERVRLVTETKER
ncbi:MAG: hypothetical protein K2X11_07805, partial [Acetobacteraceae bacterium]|nr:hypothetical protein [Acetobacteraceae bacterium]